MLGLVDAMLVDGEPGEAAEIEAELKFIIDGGTADGLTAINTTAHGYDVKGGEPVIPGPNYGDILKDKIAGGNLTGAVKPDLGLWLV